jgi:hypothetical protein
MDIAVFSFLGVVGGAVAGAAFGATAGIGWTGMAHTSCFDGYCAQLVFSKIMPASMALGALAGAGWFGFLASRAR